MISKALLPSLRPERMPFPAPSGRLPRGEPSRLGFIAQRLKNQTLVERTKGGADVSEIVGRADDQAVSVSDLVKHFGKSVTAHTNTEMVWQFTPEA